MESEAKTWLADIRQAIAEIREFLPESIDYAQFREDLKTKRAIERNIEIIGEAMGRLLNYDPDFPINDARRIVDARNRIIHGYDTVSDAIIWSIVKNDLSGLESEVTELLKKDA